jgi:Tol biopolymer transport system component
VVSVKTYPQWEDAFTSVRGDKQPAFSPSGASMAVVNDSSGQARIYITRANGANRRLLTNGYQPDWQPLR